MSLNTFGDIEDIRYPNVLLLTLTKTHRINSIIFIVIPQNPKTPSGGDPVDDGWI